MIGRSRRSLMVLGAAACAVLVGAAVLAQGGPYTLAWYALGSGGGSTGGGYTLNAVLGQPSGSTSTGGGYVLTSGAGAPAVATATPTEAATPDPRTAADAFEPDDTCSQARPLTVDALAQEHTFHRPGDADWVVFPATQGAKYRIEAEVPTGSRANIVFEVYENCGVTRLGGAGEAFTNQARLVIEAPATGSLRVRVTNNDSAVAGADVRYRLSVRQHGAKRPVGAVIIVAGRIATNDDALPAIRAVTERAFKIFQTHGYENERIYFLSTDATQVGYDAPATLKNLEFAITQWAVERVGPDRALTIYMMDHGDEDKFYLDLPNKQVLTPQMLASWLRRLPTSVPVNIIIEACHSGSFIEGDATISAPNRVVISSTNVKSDAWVGDTVAFFSDYLFGELAQERDLYTSFRNARERVLKSWAYQDAWLDANGNGKQNEDGDIVIAAQRGFQLGTLDDDVYPPTITYAVGPGVVDGNQGVIQAQVLDNKRVAHVWASIYPPSYSPPPADDRLAQAETLTATLILQGGDFYAADYTGFTEPGFYRIVVNAVDEDGLLAEPAILHVLKGEVLFLPSVAK